jgi:hypothetical protein
VGAGVGPDRNSSDPDDHIEGFNHGIEGFNQWV